MEELIKRMLSLKTEERRQLARVVRSDKSIWNAVFGVGSEPEHLEDGMIEGLVRDGSKLMSEVTVKAFNAKIDYPEKINIIEDSSLKEIVVATGEGDPPPVQQAITDENGYYALSLPVGAYFLTFERGGNRGAVIRDVMIITGHTDTRNALFT